MNRNFQGYHIKYYESTMGKLYILPPPVQFDECVLIKFSPHYFKPIFTYPEASPRSWSHSSSGACRRSFGFLRSFAPANHKRTLHKLLIIPSELILSPPLRSIGRLQPSLCVGPEAAGVLFTFQTPRNFIRGLFKNCAHAFQEVLQLTNDRGINKRREYFRLVSASPINRHYSADKLP